MAGTLLADIKTASGDLNLISKLQLHPKSQNPKMTLTGLVSLNDASPRLHDIRLILDITTLNPALLDGVSTAHLSHLGSHCSTQSGGFLSKYVSNNAILHICSGVDQFTTATTMNNAWIARS
jgi:hypothetical protein